MLDGSQMFFLIIFFLNRNINLIAAVALEEKRNSYSQCYFREREREIFKLCCVSGQSSLFPSAWVQLHQLFALHFFKMLPSLCAFGAQQQLGCFMWNVSQVLSWTGKSIWERQREQRRPPSFFPLPSVKPEQPLIFMFCWSTQAGSA